MAKLSYPHVVDVVPSGASTRVRSDYRHTRACRVTETNVITREGSDLNTSGYIETKWNALTGKNSLSTEERPSSFTLDLATLLPTPKSFWQEPYPSLT